MSFLTSALGGSILGGILSIAQRFTDVFAKKKEAEVEVMRAKALSELKIKEAELDAFKTSLSTQDEDFDPDPLPSDAPKWAMLLRAGAETLRVLVDAFRGFTRPGLTWALVISVVALLALDKFPAEMAQTILADLVFTMSTAVMWWFGSRPLQRTAK